MKTIPEDRQIYISARLWHEIHQKVDLSPFIFALHEGIDLTRYGKAIKKFHFTFIIVKPDDEINRPASHFDQMEKVADISISIPYEQVLKASKTGLIKLMETAYLKGIEELDSFPLEDNFDVSRFKEDVSAIFSQDKWYETTITA
jgi:hypothetical protein